MLGCHPSRQLSRSQVKGFFAYSLLAFLFPLCAYAQGGLEGRITDVIASLVRILNVLIVGFVAWAGFLIAKGDDHGQARLIYGVVGLVVVNASYLIINYFI